MPKISQKARTIIVLSIGVIFILFGVSQAIFDYEVDKDIVDTLSFVLMATALVVFMYGRGRKADGAKENKNAEADKTEPDAPVDDTGEE